MSTETKEVGFARKKYSDLLKMGKEALDLVKIPFEVRKAENDMKREVIVLEQAIAEQELKIQEAKGARPINLKSILDAIDEKDLKERDLKLAKELQAELF